ncbi:hypothetical protein L0Y34_00345 [Candidatus Parcubacteria bacterium]|nr:hypothetical protein [Candidatus Parcubacteria bacterium]
MNPTPAPVVSSPSSPPHEPEPKTSYGALIGMLVVVAAVVLAAWYFLGQRTSLWPSSEDAGLTELETQSTSTDPAVIEADLMAESPDEFDDELDEAFAELDASFESQ